MEEKHPHDQFEEPTGPQGGDAPAPEPEENWEQGLRFDPDSDSGAQRADEVEATTESQRPQQRDERRRDFGRDRDRDRGGRDRRRGGGGRGQQVEELGASSGIDVLDPHRVRKPGAPSAGLTLSDLLPFLRPPRTVLLLSATTGCGHGRMASALAEAFRGLDRNLIVRESDMLDLLNEARSATEVRYELDEISRAEDLFGKPFANGSEHEGQTAEERIAALAKDLFGDRFDHAVVEKRPDHIVVTHWLALQRLAGLKEASRLTASVTMVIAEPDIHAHWVSPVVSHYIVANDYVKTRLVRRGVAEDAVSVCGVPVSPAFAGLPERDRQRQALGLRGIVVAVRTDGFGAKAVKFVRSIIDAHAQTALIIAAARGDAALKDLQALDGTNACTVRVVEGPEAFRDVMSTVDLVVTRANLHSAAECMAAGVPMLLIRPHGSTEERMADRLLARGIAARANCEEDFADLLAELLRNRRALQQMQDLALQGKKPTAAQETVDRIARLVR